MQEGKMNKEQKRYIGLIIGISFWAGIGLMSLANIVKVVYNQHALSYDWIMLVVSIIIIIICLIYLIKRKQAF
jgi:O-antigen/teichoic acid export membrane protein